MSRLKLVVRSSNPDVSYNLSAYRTESGIRFSCGCPAGSNGNICKHRTSLLVGDITDLDPSSKSTIDDLLALFDGHPILHSIARMLELEAAIETMQNQIKEEKRMIAVSFMG